ncbi:trans-aconitate 3-methyltransferase [Aspergillus lentulus]|uniref:Trans-aconitate 3-methyltransferase n=1 Tax=Aspergillus lentulus TaxID=293939 RepID=A0ABQ0ZTW2_ASPLE|nr:trans-aconitate 3-methyltransferase [Aspergillus lentulus]GFF99156.1 trans-aconitate 3-methyltransferase [Aspergillus lentulus]
MASFASNTFSHQLYAAFRPTYSKQLYSAVLAYHRGPSKTALDLGTGHGLVARELSPHFQQVLASDPSAGMIQEARQLSAGFPNITFHQERAEECPFAADAQVDLVTAAQSSHWFDYAKLWPEMRRIVRSGGTLAFWGYKDHVLVSYSRATSIINEYAYGQDPWLLGSYWQQPGRSIVQQKLRAVQPPVEDWEDVTRDGYEPGADGGTRFMHARMTLGSMEEYVRTWSSFHAWQRKWQDRTRRAPGNIDQRGDVVDEMMDKIRETESSFQRDNWKDVEVDVEWGNPSNYLSLDYTTFINTARKLTSVIFFQMAQTATLPTNSIRIRTHKPADIDWIISRHGTLYADEYNFNDKFIALVSKIASEFQQNHDPTLERCWIAERTTDKTINMRVGCMMLVKDTDSPDTARLRLFLVEPRARGMGVGRSLIKQCIEFAREVGYKRVVLWTQSILGSARRLYKAEGFQLVKEEEHEGFGMTLVGELWELELEKKSQDE